MSTQHRRYARLAAFAIFLLVPTLQSGAAIAHCDTMDGPVVGDAQKALAAKDVTPVLKWIPAKDEDEVKRAFDLAIAVRGESDQAKQVADTYFFETLVRIHRQSEGESFTGLKPAETVDPAIDAADRALADGNIDPLADKLAAAVRDEIRNRFAAAYEKKQVAGDSVQQGREFVHSYVLLTHFVEGLDHIVAKGVDHVVPHGVGQQHGH